MSGSARLSQTAVLGDVRTAMTSFREEVEAALIAVDLEMNRTLTWIQNDQLKYWKQQHRRWNDKLSEAKGELHRKQITSFNRESNSYVEEKQAIRKCQMQMEHAEQKVQLCKLWARRVEEAITEYKAQSVSLAAALDHEIPQALAMLDHMADALEQYLKLSAPQTDRQGAPPPKSDSSRDAT